jgi:hypothetical protein
MADNDFTHEEALQAILRRLRANQSDGIRKLADEIESIIDQGRLDSVDQTIEAIGAKTSKKVLKARSLTDLEALEVAVNLLRTYFLELPMIISSLEEEFSMTGYESEFELGYEDAVRLNSDTVGKLKRVQIEVTTETTRFKDTLELIDLPKVAEDAIESQTENFEQLRRLLNLGANGS